MLHLILFGYYFIRRLGEYNKDLSQEEKYSNRLRMVRKKHTKRASKYSLEPAADLTHFGKRIADMPKSELRQAYIGSGDERDEEPFSYDSLIAKSKEFRAAARRQKMEAEAELEELDSSLSGSVWKSLARREIVDNRQTIAEDDDDLAFLARSFQMENIRKATAGDRKATQAEIDESRNVLLRQSIVDREAANADDSDVGEAVADEDSDTGSITVEPTDAPEVKVVTSTSLIPYLKNLLLEKRVPVCADEIRRLREMGRDCPSVEILELFNQHISENADLLIFELAAILFPLDHSRHPIAVPALKVLELKCMNPDAKINELKLLAKFLGKRYSPVFFKLASRLFSKHESEVMTLVVSVCCNFTQEALWGVLQYYFPTLISEGDELPEFQALKLHQFKPVEVLSLEPSFHEDGYTGEHKEMREAKRLEQQFKKDKRLTAKEMRREANAHETLFAMDKKKEQVKTAINKKRNIAALDQAESNFRLMQTDNGKEPTKQMKRNKTKGKGKGRK